MKMIHYSEQRYRGKSYRRVCYSTLPDSTRLPCALYGVLLPLRSQQTMEVTSFRAVVYCYTKGVPFVCRLNITFRYDGLHNDRYRSLLSGQVELGIAYIKAQASAGNEPVPSLCRRAPRQLDFHRCYGNKTEQRL